MLAKKLCITSERWVLLWFMQIQHTCGAPISGHSQITAYGVLDVFYCGNEAVGPFWSSNRTFDRARHCANSPRSLLHAVQQSGILTYVSSTAGCGAGYATNPCVARGYMYVVDANGASVRPAQVVQHVLFMSLFL